MLIMLGGQAEGVACVDDEDADKVAPFSWHRTSSGHVARSVNVGDRIETVYLHRSVLGLPIGSGPRVLPINGDKLDCRKANLRLASKWVRELMSTSPLAAEISQFILQRLAATEPAMGR